MPHTSILANVVSALATKLIDFLPAAVQHWQQFTPPQGVYEVLEHAVKLELLDKQGEKAHYRKRQHVRFLQDNVMAFYDTVWGDGEIFVDYQCSPGVAVDRFREGHRYKVLISLREMKQRGDQETFYISRTIYDGFVADEESLQTDIDHQTRSVKVSLVFPSSRIPRKVLLTETRRKQTSALGDDHLHELPDGRYEVSWNKTNPRLHESYILKWIW